MRAVAIALAMAVAGCAGCLRVGEERAERDLDVGLAAAGGVELAAVDGLAHVRAIDDGAVTLWQSAPDVVIHVEVATGATPAWTVAVENTMPDGELAADGGVAVTDLGRERSTVGRWEVVFPGPGSYTLRLAPPDAGERAAYRFAVMGDVQDALARVDEVFAEINATPGLRFVASTGDLVENAVLREYDLWEEKLVGLELPFYTTIGNHELYGKSGEWSRRFGRHSVHFRFKGVVFSLVDSGNASIDPDVYAWLDEWLAGAADDVHLFLTHFPPLDPVGVRAGGFRSRREANKLVSRLAGGEVDVTFYGHIHSYYAFENGGIPAYISGGGGAYPERWDGIGRHFLAVTVDPEAGVDEVAVVRVDD